MYLVIGRELWIRRDLQARRSIIFDAFGWRRELKIFPIGIRNVRNFLVWIKTEKLNLQDKLCHEQKKLRAPWVSLLLSLWIDSTMFKIAVLDISNILFAITVCFEIPSLSLSLIVTLAVFVRLSAGTQWNRPQNERMFITTRLCVSQWYNWATI